MKNGEKRNYTRMDSLHLLDYLVVDREGGQTAYSMGRTLDVSERGLKLEVTQPVINGDILLITLGLANNLIDIVGKVRHSNRIGSSYAIGVEFSDISENGMQILKNQHYFL